MLIDFYFSACKQTIGSESVIFCAISHVLGTSSCDTQFVMTYKSV